MDRLRTIINRLLFPNIILKLAFTIFSAAMLTYTFTYGAEDTPLAYSVYLISAYTLTVLAIHAVQITKQGVNDIISKRPYAVRYLSDPVLRAEISLAVSTLMNILYAAFKIAAGILYHSIWSGATGCYYIVLSLIRIILMHNNIYTKKLSAGQLHRSCPQRSFTEAGAAIGYAAF